jgi:hypothetical protein
VEAVAQYTPGFSEADIANLVNEAALLASLNEKEAVDMADYDGAFERVVAGSERCTRSITPNEMNTWLLRSITRFARDIPFGIFWWRGWDLNPHPRAYESPAPPLSYLANRQSGKIVLRYPHFVNANLNSITSLGSPVFIPLWPS